MVKTTLRMDAELVALIRWQALQRRMSMNACVQDILRGAIVDAPYRPYLEPPPNVRTTIDDDFALFDEIRHALKKKKGKRA